MPTSRLPPIPAPVLDAAFVSAFRSGTLTEQQADDFASRDPLQLRFLLLQLSLAVAAGATPAGPHTPSGSIPPYAKPNAAPRRNKKKRGARAGHPGKARPAPEHVDHHVEHRLPVCPCCHGQLRRAGRSRIRYVEDIPADLRSEVTGHTIHRDWCPSCKKQVEPVVPDALPGCALGHRTAVLSAWLHYGLGNTTSQIAEVFNGHLRLKISEGGLTEIWHRLANVLKPWHEQIRQRCLNAAVLHADETGWRNAGLLAWLWCFARDDSTYYLIHPRRGHEALRVFFTEAFHGVLVTDFWKAYDVVTTRRQKCWPHLLRELSATDDGRENGEDWPGFSKKLWRIYGDAVRLEAGIEAMGQDTYDSRVARLHTRVADLAAQAWANRHARRLAKRLAEYGEDLLRFLHVEGVPSSNNKAEREIRPAVLMRKASYGSASDKGAETRSVLMSIYRTLKQRGLDPLQETETALRQYMQTGLLPPLPQKTASAG
jgi:transposase